MKEGLLEYSTSETPTRECFVKKGDRVVLLKPPAMYGLPGTIIEADWKPLYSGSSDKCWQVKIILDRPYSITSQGLKMPMVNRCDTEVEPA